MDVMALVLVALAAGVAFFAIALLGIWLVMVVGAAALCVPGLVVRGLARLFGYMGNPDILEKLGNLPPPGPKRIEPTTVRQLRRYERTKRVAMR